MQKGSLKKAELYLIIQIFQAKNTDKNGKAIFYILLKTKIKHTSETTCVFIVICSERQNEFKFQFFIFEHRFHWTPSLLKDRTVGTWRSGGKPVTSHIRQ